MVRILFLIPVMLCLCSGRAAAQCEEAFLLPADTPREMDLFGDSVALDGARAVVGKPGDDVEFSNAGAAYVFERAGNVWSQTAKLFPWWASNDDDFGSAVHLDGDVVVVGCPGDDELGVNAGCAYVYRRLGGFWLPDGRLLPSVPVGSGRFGSSVSVKGDLIAVGGPGNNGDFDGHADVFRYDGATWQQETLPFPANAGSSQFGFSVSIDGSYVAVGAKDAFVNGSHGGGRTYIYFHDGVSWTEQQFIEERFETRFLGTSVSLDDPVLAIGTGQQHSYVYRRTGSTWNEEADLLCEGTVSIDDDYLIVGSHVYTRFGPSWAELGEMVGSQSTVGLHAAGHLDGTKAIMGSTFFDDNVPQAGAAYIFDVVDTFCVCLAGTVNSNLGPVENVLFVNGSSGGRDRQVQVDEGEPVFAYMVRPSGGGNGRYVVHANSGPPGQGTATQLPFDVGLACFPLLNASPVAVWNNIGARNAVGHSSYFGASIPRSSASDVVVPRPPGRGSDQPPGGHGSDVRRSHRGSGLGEPEARQHDEHRDPGGALTG